MNDQQPRDYVTIKDRLDLDNLDMKPGRIERLPRGERRSDLRSREALAAWVAMALAFGAGVGVGWWL